jgi:hypothetical protein
LPRPRGRNTPQGVDEEDGGRDKENGPGDIDFLPFTDTEFKAAARVFLRNKECK